MFRILCDPSSGSTELCLTEITRVVHRYFVVCLVGVWQRNFEPVVCVYLWLAGRTVHTHTHHRYKITLPNTDQAHDKISVNQTSNFSQAQLCTP